MEGSSYNPEFERQDEAREKKRPKVETIGSLVVEANPERGQAKQHSKEKLGHALIDLETRKNSPEKNFELDPVLRGHGDDFAHAGTSTTSLSGLLEKADAAIDGQSGTTGHAKAKPAARSKVKTTTQRRVVDVVMIGIILILATLVVVLASTR
jgi:hypothetical protein